MATACTDNTGSDHVVEYCCSSCEEDAISQEAAYYCKLCSKFFCCQCLKFHGKLFKKHETYGRTEIDQWPVSKVTQDVLENCREHKDEHLKFYCEDHRLMCCNSCVVFNHRQCASVISIDQLLYEEEITDDLQQLQEKIESILEQMKQLQNDQERSIITLLDSYNKSLQEIKNARSKIDSILNKLEKDTVQKLDDVLINLNTPFQKDVEDAIRLSSDLRDLEKAIQEMMTKGKELSFTAYNNCIASIRECEKYIHDYSNIKEVKMFFKTNTLIEKYLSQRPSLGMILHSNQVEDQKEISVLCEAIYGVRHKDDKNPPKIQGMCVQDNIFFMTDFNNKNVKLLNSDYSLLCQSDLDFCPYGMYQCPSNYEIAISGESQTQFISSRRINEQLYIINKHEIFQFHHDCFGIAIHKDDMYITSGTALFHYNRDGKPVKKLYENLGAGVRSCAVNQTGDKIFVTNWSELLTLSRDGNILCTFTDPLLQNASRDLYIQCGFLPFLQNAPAVHVTDKGQVLVCWKNNIIQVDSEGKRKISILAIPNVDYPLCMCSAWKSIIVGFSNILVLKIE